MQLVTHGGQTLAYFDNGVSVPMDAFPADAALVPYVGSLEALGRLGEEPLPGQYDTRPYKAPASVNLHAYASLRRKAVEYGGITIGDAVIDTSEKSQAKIGNAFALLTATGDPSVEFLSESGWVSMPAEQLKALAIAVGRHVQGCYAKHSQVDAAISAGTITTMAEIDAAFAALSA